ncbi:PspC domain-containing protein [Paenibacillus sp. GYB004]|uniref:PspC domain-containing protein n=1 Tax=Paenibacillus sp. GYB004 TaxID=2994393 RepID=UPI002F967B49
MKKLYRSRRDSKLFGLCGGLAELLNVDSTLLRVVLLVTAFFTGGTLIPIYFIACLVIPKEPAFDPFYNPTYGYPNRPDYGPGPYHSDPHYRGGSYYGSSSGTTHQPYGSSTYSSGYGSKPPSYGPGYQPQTEAPPSAAGPAPQKPAPNLDEMMRDVEKKALQKEIEELRAKLAQYEKSDK